MNREHLRFSPGIDVDKYNKDNPPSNPSKLSDYQLRALSSAWSLMENFKHIEQGLARLIIVGVGLNTPSDPAKWKSIKYQLGKLFSFSEQIDMVNQLVQEGCLKLSDSEIMELPTGFMKPELPYFQSCRLAMEYRNELAHTGFIIFVEEHSGQYTHHAVIGADNPRSQNPNDIFQAVAIDERSQLEEETFKCVHYAFADWIFHIANRLPIFMGEPIVTPTDKTIDSAEFFASQKSKIDSQLDKLKVSKPKKLDKFIESLK